MHSHVPRVAILTALALPAVLCYLIFIKKPNFANRNVGPPEPYDPLKEEALKFWERRGIVPGPTQYIVRDPTGRMLDDIQAYRSNLLLTKPHREEDMAFNPVTFNFDTDVLVQLHIQKTGGTQFEDFLVFNRVSPCKCGPMPGVPTRLMCSCLNKMGQDWLFNRHAVGWPCGVHGGFSELTSCVDRWYRNQANETRKRNYYHVTMLRDPISRFMSEWLHVRRGATWKECRLHCDGRDATIDEVPFCFKGGNWSGTSFEDFISCPGNMAFNRMTRMLANLSLSDCYRLQSNKTQAQRDEIMLESAKNNLARFFKYFGLLEYPTESQILFERTFANWRSPGRRYTDQYSQGDNFATISETVWDSVTSLNTLDIRLYQYAKDLFLERLKRANIPLVPRPNAPRRVRGTFKFGVVNKDDLPTAAFF